MTTRILPQRLRLGFGAVLLTLIAGFAAPVVPTLQATTSTANVVELSPTPPDQTQAVGPNVVLTFDDSGSMQSSRLNDYPPFTTDNNGDLINAAYDWGNCSQTDGSSQCTNSQSGGGPWRCAGVIDPDHSNATDATARAMTMNGVYYNPNITYKPPMYADGTSFPNADPTLLAVDVDEMALKRPLSPATLGSVAFNNNPDLDKPGSGAMTNVMGLYNSTTQGTTVWYAAWTACPSSADNGSCTTQTPASVTTAGVTTYTYYTWYDSSAKLKWGQTCPSGSTCQSYSGTGSTFKNYYTWSVTSSSTDNRWMCGTGPNLNSNGGGGDNWTGTVGASPMDGLSHSLTSTTTGSSGTTSSTTNVTYPNGGPYYFRLKTSVTITLTSAGIPDSTSLANIYTAGNWEAVPVPPSQYQNFANWYAYYRTRNQMARSSLSLVFGAMGGKTANGGYGSAVRAAWQNLDTSTYKLPSTAIISELIDTANCTTNTASPKTTQSPTTTTTPPDCYRSAFFNFLFQVPASGGTPTRSAVARAGQFFSRGGASGSGSSAVPANTASTGTLLDPYWEPAAVDSTGTTVGPAHELYCRQNFHMLVTDGLWNGNTDGPKTTALTGAPVGSSLTLPDNVSFPDTSPANSVTSIYAPVVDGGDSGYAALSGVAFHYWAKNLRPDLYIPAINHNVPPYLPDQTKSVFSTSSTTSSSLLTSTQINQEIYFNPKNDPATWPHMSQYLVGLGVNGQLVFSTDTDCLISTSSDACNLRKGNTNSSSIVGWPTPDGTGGGIAANVDDTWHAALAARGAFFNAANPQSLISQLTTVLTSISARAAIPTVAAVNASVLTLGSVSFNTGYSSLDWSGILNAVTLNTDGSIGANLWKAADTLTNSDTNTNPNFITPANRNIYTAVLNSTGNGVTGATFAATTSFDTTETKGLNFPASTDSTNDTLTNRVNYLRGDRTQETNGIMRTRTSLLGAIIDSQPVYVSYPASGYTNNWPTGSNEVASGAQTYDDFVTTHINRPGTVYVGANDGMLHAFDASLACSKTDPTTNKCTAYGPNQASTAGQERFAYVPRAVYSNLGTLTSLASFSFQQTVNSTPVVRDVFYGNKWHTILVGGLRLGGRGVYALDITDPTTFGTSNVLWEFDADMTSSVGTPGNLGYTYGQPNIGRLANGKWVVLVPGGYFPNCSAGAFPLNCTTPTAASNGYSALFILDAQTGAVIREIDTPTTINGTAISSYGLSSPVLGDYDNNQVDDVAFAGDLVGNLWRYDLSNSDPTKWSVSLAFQPATAGAQPITAMPRLFPDPATNRFIVVFGTGQYLGPNDNSTTGVQSMYGIRDMINSSGNPITITRSQLQAQTLSETTISNTASPYNGETLRKLTTNTLTSSQGGWYFDLKTTDSSGNVDDAGERVTVTAGAIFNSNTVVVSTLIPTSTDPCNPQLTGSVMLVDATTGGAGSGVSTLGGGNFVGARTNNVRTSGTVPVTTAVGGGKILLPGITLSNNTSTKGTTFTGDAPLWRRRSWSTINP